MYFTKKNISMKKTYLLLGFLFISIIVLSQTKKRKGVITFNDGTTISGYIRNSGNNMRFSKERRGKEIKYKNNLIKKIKINREGKYIVYYFKTEVGKSKPIMLEKVLHGKANLYLITTYESIPFFGYDYGFQGIQFIYNFE